MQPFHRRLISILLLAAGLTWSLVSADHSGNSTAGQIPAPRQGFLAPDFSLQTLTGENLRLADLRGQVILVNLWASWCPPCRAEMPTLQKMYAEYKDQGFTILAVNMTSQDDPAAIQPFVQQYGITFPVLLDPNGDTARLYELRSLPSSFFLDRQGIIREVVIGGPMAEALLRTRIETLLQP
ncbi:MAG: TlpA disulfide reductase family protein [Anaerolineales bacterium]